MKKSVMLLFGSFALFAKTTVGLKCENSVSDIEKILYIQKLEKDRKILMAQREGSLDVRRFKQMKLYRSNLYRDQLDKLRER